MDIEQPECLIEYLQRRHHIGPEEVLSVEVLQGGVSNRTVLVKRETGDDWVIKQALAKLRVATDWYSSPERVHREALGMKWLHELAPSGAITRLLFEDYDEHLLCMEAVPQPHTNWKSMLLAGDIRSEHIWQFGHLLGTIHRRSTERASELKNTFDDRSFFESLRLEPYYAFAAQQVPAAAPFLEQLLTETRSRRECLVHGDYSPKNVLVYQARLILLDHEVIHWGDPAFDLGFSLTPLSSSEMIDQIDSWCVAYPIISVEDGLAEDDWEAWPLLTERLAGRAIILGDDLLCTNSVRISRAIASRSANALLLKVNQIGTLTEALAALRLAVSANWHVTISARSGETEDNWLADLAVGWGANQIKVGSITQSERLSKYNRLLQIEAELRAVSSTMQL